MGKFLKSVDVSAQALKVDKAVKKYLKICGCNTGAVTYDLIPNGQAIFEIENDGVLGSDIDFDVLRKMNSVIVLNVFEYKGSYDWMADTYIRPRSVIVVTFQPK